MSNYKLLGKNFTPPDVLAKVTGQAKYAEDFRVEGMVFCRFLPSPFPHAKVKSIDASEALKMEGVLGILTADEVTPQPAPMAPILTNEPHYVGEPVLALAAVDETTVQNALEKIKIEWEPLPFTINPLNSLQARPGGCAPRRQHRRRRREARHPALDEGRLRQRQRRRAAHGQARAGLELGRPRRDLRQVQEGLRGHVRHRQQLPITAWNRARRWLTGRTVSASCTAPRRASRSWCRRWRRSSASSRISSSTSPSSAAAASARRAAPIRTMAIPPLMSKKINRPVMMRVSRFEEYAIGSARNGLVGRVKLGFAENGKLLAADLYVVQEGGANLGFWDFRNAADLISIMYQPEAMRWRGVPVFCNTPTRSAQRGPGYNQMAYIMEPLIDRAARDLGIDRIEMRRLNGRT